MEKYGRILYIYFIKFKPLLTHFIAFHTPHFNVVPSSLPRHHHDKCQACTNIPKFSHQALIFHKLRLHPFVISSIFHLLQFLSNFYIVLNIFRGRVFSLGMDCTISIGLLQVRRIPCFARCRCEMGERASSDIKFVLSIH